MMTKLGMSLARFLLIRYLELKPDAVKELEKIDGYEFDIFKLRTLTEGRELETILPFILSNKGLIGNCKIEFTNLMNFVKALTSGYKNITYHN